MNTHAAPVVCSECFRDQGLRLEARRLGVVDATVCPNCCAASSHKLNAGLLTTLAYDYSVWGSLRRLDYGAAPLIQFNERESTSITVPSWLEADVQLIGQILGVGFF